MKFKGILCVGLAVVGASSLGLSGDIKPVAILESSQHPRHRDNIVDIIGKKNANVYLTVVSNDQKYINTLRRISYGPERIVNLSIQSCTFNIKEKALIEQMITDGKLVVVAGGNKDIHYRNCKNIYPASYKLKGLIVAGYKDGHHKNVDIFAKGTHCVSKHDCLSGSSQSTAYVSRKALKMFRSGISISNIIKHLDKK